MKFKGPIKNLFLLFPAAFLIVGCQLVENDAQGDEKALVSSAPGGDMAVLVDEIWDDKVLPHLKDAAVDFTELKPALDRDLDTAGNKYGYRPSSEGSPWNFATRIDGEIVSAKTDTRAATLDVDTNNDGNADAVVQLGPVIRGTTLRDVLPFIDFTSFTDQIEFAQLSRALNTKTYETVLADLTRDGLVGKRVIVLGAFTMRKADDAVLVTPVEIDVVAQ